MKLQRIHDRAVIDGKQHRLVIREILVRMPLPERHHESVTLLPLQVTLANSGPAPAANYVIDRRAGVAMRFSGMESITLCS